MRILYRQNSIEKQEKSEKRAGRGLFCDFGIENCYFKRIEQEEPSTSNTKKRHSHTGYEFHMVVEGEQTYETEDGIFTAKKGSLLAIPRGRAHALKSTVHPLVKYAVTFSFSECAEDIWGGIENAICCCLPVPERILSGLEAVREYRSKSLPSSEVLIENCVFETVMLLLSAMNIREKGNCNVILPPPNGDERVELAKQFISDNIESPMQVGEVAAYCYVSEKQLTRLFRASEGYSPGEYIRRQRVKHIEDLLRIPEISLGEVSRRMGFFNESGFNAFFKKYNGMPPGEYRKMIMGGKD